MNITATSIRKPVFAWMLMAALMIFGGLAFQRMGVNLMPDVDFPYVSVQVNWEGAGPVAVESEVIDVLEDALAGVPGVIEMNSSARTGSGSVNLEFALGKDINAAIQDVQNAVFRAQRRLPRDVDPPIISKQNPEDRPIIWAAVSSDSMASIDLMKLVRDRIKNQFTTIEGVSEVFLGGYVDPAVRIWVSQEQLRQYQLTVGDLIQTIQSEHRESPAGRLETEAKEFTVRTKGEVETVEDLANLQVLRRGGSPMFAPLRLGQIVDAELGFADIRRKSRSNGKPAIGLGIRKQSGANSVEVADRVKARVAEIQKQLPSGVEIGIRNDSTRFISEAVHELNFTLLLSALLTAFVCWLFLGSLKATINVVLAIPTSILGTFIVIKDLDFTLNTFTLLGLSLAIGIVVDDAIMVLENIYRHRDMGEAPPKASYRGTREVAFAAFAATASIAAIFLPIAYMEGLIGKFLFEFGVTIAVAVGFSLLEALTLTPMRCAYMKHTHTNGVVERAGNAAFAAVERFYSRILPYVLRWRWVVITGSLAIFAASLMIFGKLKKEFVPAQDQDSLMVRAQAPTGSTLQYTDEKLAELEAVLNQRPEVAQNFVSVGGFGGGDVDTGVIFVSLHPKLERPKGSEGRVLSQQELAVVLREEFRKVKGIRASVIDLSLSGGIGGGRSYPIDFSIVGQDWSELTRLVETFTKKMEEAKIFVDVDSSFRPGLSEFQIVPDRRAAALRGVSIAEIDQTVSALVGGSNIGKFSSGGRRFDIRVRLRESERRSPDDLKKIMVRNNRGELVRLADVAKFVEVPTLQSITRKNRERSVSLYSSLAPGISQTVALEKVDEIARELLPAVGYRIVRGGTSKTFGDSMDGLKFALLLGILIAYMILASQFNSFIDPVTVLIALPFSITGALVALYLGGQSINIYSMIGIVLLMGIVKKNSILLVDFTNQVREQGKDVWQALLTACPIRLRPILMTSIATIVGVLPPALAIGPGAESRIPMAFAVLGGVIVSTILTLIVVPCVYLVLSRRHQPVVEID